ncbi:S8 family peptidase [Enterocloster bolteae]|uniref:S8 family peptidase n=1 Tax=Enterocloster bolteae TaxID=208479 RepID=UPI0028DC3368|nr:S8 family peptidase [Enterocloster bolteae]
MNLTVKRTGLLILSAFAIIQAVPFYGQNGSTEKAARQQEFRAHASPEGAVTSISGESYYQYQWALKNNGTLRRREALPRISAEPEAYGPGINPAAASQGNGTRISGNQVTAGVAGIDIGIEAAWDVYSQTTERRTVTVALIDTGVDITHPDLQNAVWVNTDEILGDGIDNDGNGYVDDVNGWNFYSGNNQVFSGREDNHGTHGAGTIAGAWDGQGITGIADSGYVKIMVLKALGSEEGRGVSDNVKQAICYAQENGADICNLSMGADVYDEELEAMIRNSPMLFVVSAGNGDERDRGFDIDARPVYPASYTPENIITVGNLMFDGSLAENSNFGAASVDIAAPGTYILSTVPGGYGYMSGTSMAAPMVTGTAALIYSCRTDLSLMDVKRAILESARKLDGLSGKTVTGGILDAYAVLTFH